MFTLLSQSVWSEQFSTSFARDVVGAKAYETTKLFTPFFGVNVTVLAVKGTAVPCGYSALTMVTMPCNDLIETVSDFVWQSTRHPGVEETLETQLPAEGCAACGCPAFFVGGADFAAPPEAFFVFVAFVAAFFGDCFGGIGISRFYHVIPDRFKKKLWI